MSQQLDPLSLEVVDLMANLVALFHKEYEEAASARSLTGAQAKVLALLRRGPMPMRQIAQTMSCEPSNITGIVDRRIKRVAATEAGRAASAELRESQNFARAPLAALEPDEREQLRDLLQRIVEGAQQPR